MDMKAGIGALWPAAADTWDGRSCMTHPSRNPAYGSAQASHAHVRGAGGRPRRVLLRDSRILILDEDTSSVDAETEGMIRQALERLMQGRTTFIIAHRIQSVMIADLILVLDKGQIVQKGSHEELLAQPGIYRQIYDLQTRIETEVEREVASVSL